MFWECSNPKVECWQIFLSQIIMEYLILVEKDGRCEYYSAHSIRTHSWPVKKQCPIVRQLYIFFLKTG